MSMSTAISDAFRQVAADQIAQDINNQATFALRTSIPTKLSQLENDTGFTTMSNGADVVVNIQQIIAFYNGYMNTNLDYRNYLSVTQDDIYNSLNSFGNSYLGV